jgi:pimeloyl-ACP methyl ester carboxylesterase
VAPNLRQPWWRNARGACLLLSTALLLIASPLGATTLQLKDGRTLEGPFVQVAGVAETPLSINKSAGEVAITPLLLVDDGLRRTFIHRTNVQAIDEQGGDRKVRIRLWQDVPEQGTGVGRVGAGGPTSQFDEYGRRIYQMHTPDGPLAVVQGITEITPVYTKVEGLRGGQRNIVWDMRIATSSIPRETLHKILKTSIPQDNLDARLQVVRLYLQSDRYRDAELELAEIIKDFPEMTNLSDQVQQLRQLGARLVLREIQLRARAGQTQLARTLLAKFPSDGVSGGLLQQVRELLAKYEADDERRTKLLATLNTEIAAIADSNGRRLAEQFAQEITAEANAEALNRLASFERLADAKELTPEQKVALAISGWLVGANDATDDFQVALSLADTRDYVVAYMREPSAAERSRLATEIRDRDGTSVENVARILKLMKPPLDVPEDAQSGPGRFEMTIPGLAGHSDIRYLVQLPPEYDPLRRYPVIIGLPDAGMPAEWELAFWAGDPRDDGEPRGQATRHGYITIAVDWLEPKQTTVDYSAREHQAVLGVLRDANRRFSIDTDRVFLAGHGLGGNAAWDIALAHPDLWAGVIPIVALADRYVFRYGRNAEYLSWYFVAGELDGDKMAVNARELDKYVGAVRTRPNVDATVVEYQGRGYEAYPDEIQRLFDWMNRRKRTMPKEFECVSMRPWDNFFWWLEVNELPDKAMIAPANWPPPRTARPTVLRSKIANGNKIQVETQALDTTVWLAPEFINFAEPITVEVNRRSLTPDRTVRPNLSTLLEDARTRADRQHPFWAKVESMPDERGDFTNR